VPESSARWLIVGSGTRFLSGISYYTARLSAAASGRHEVAVIPMRRLLPRWAYPGRQRVGVHLTEIDYGASTVHPGIDWFWFGSLRSGLRFMRTWAPDVVVFEWWTGTVLHTYLVLAALAKRRGARVVIEFHEVQDTGEAKLPLVGRYVRALARRLMRGADAFVIHSEADRAPLSQTYELGDKPIAIVPHGPYDHHPLRPGATPLRAAPRGVCNVLFFGTIRPYKGLEDLVEAFSSLNANEVRGLWLTVVGETWEGWTRPLAMIEASPHRERITVVNRYVTDNETAACFAGADAVVLPYHRSSASGPLHIAMSEGLPVIVTAVGGLAEAAGNYGGVRFVDPRRPDQIGAELRRLPADIGRRYADPHSWEHSVDALEELFARIGD
jgi:glycosyltransferase involved in cell wall biosynthesis